MSNITYAAHRFTTQEDRIADALIESGERVARAIAAQQAIEEQEKDMRQLIKSIDGAA